MNRHSKILEVMDTVPVSRRGRNGYGVTDVNLRRKPRDGSRNGVHKFAEIIPQASAGTMAGHAPRPKEGTQLFHRRCGWADSARPTRGTELRKTKG